MSTYLVSYSNFTEERYDTLGEALLNTVKLGYMGDAKVDMNKDDCILSIYWFPGVGFTITEEK